jgi:2-polyprenyl-3-methyl-5-hydroxy-6-metoxy-1,4-benzoquinol methylase
MTEKPEPSPHMTARTCILCGGPCKPVVDGVRDNRFGSPGQWMIMRCTACGLEQTDPAPTQAELKALYETHYNYGGEHDTAYTDWREKFLMSPLYQLMLRIDGDISFHGAKGAGRLLDVGCNEGRGLSLYHRNGFEAEGLELNAKAARVARARGFAVHETDIADFRPSAPFDRVVISNVLEHVLDPRDTLRHIHRLLKAGGEVWISLPNARSAFRGIFGRDWINWHVPFHITHFTEPRLSALLEETGFDPASRRQMTPALWVAQSAIAWIYEGQPGQPRKLRHPLMVPALMLVARLLLFPVLWGLNRTGRGDCLVIRARKR